MGGRETRRRLVGNGLTQRFLCRRESCDGSRNGRRGRCCHIGHPTRFRVHREEGISGGGAVGILSRGAAGAHAGTRVFRSLWKSYESLTQRKLPALRSRRQRLSVGSHGRDDHISLVFQGLAGVVRNYRRRHRLTKSLHPFALHASGGSILSPFHSRCVASRAAAGTTQATAAKAATTS